MQHYSQFTIHHLRLLEFNELSIIHLYRAAKNDGDMSELQAIFDFKKKPKYLNLKSKYCCYLHN